MKIIELLKVSELKKLFPNKNSNLFKTPYIYLNGRSHVIFSPGFCDEKNLNSWRSKCKVKVWESPFIPSHLTFKSFKFHSIALKQRQHKSNNQSKLFI